MFFGFGDPFHSRNHPLLKLLPRFSAVTPSKTDILTPKRKAFGEMCPQFRERHIFPQAGMDFPKAFFLYDRHIKQLRGFFCRMIRPLQITGLDGIGLEPMAVQIISGHTGLFPPGLRQIQITVSQKGIPLIGLRFSMADQINNRPHILLTIPQRSRRRAARRGFSSCGVFCFLPEPVPGLLPRPGRGAWAGLRNRSQT